MGKWVWGLLERLHTRVPNGWRVCSVYVPMGTGFTPYWYPNRVNTHRVAGRGPRLTFLGAGWGAWWGTRQRRRRRQGEGGGVRGATQRSGATTTNAGSVRLEVAVKPVGAFLIALLWEGQGRTQPNSERLQVPEGRASLAAATWRSCPSSASSSCWPLQQFTVKMVRFLYSAAEAEAEVS